MYPTLHPSFPKKETTKNHFTVDEDERLKSLVSEYGDKDWKLISNYMPGRSSRQCRERYIGYLNPSLTTKPWTEAEDALLIEKLKDFGPKWTKMVPFFEGRSDCSIKNRWYKHLSKHAKPSFINSVFNRNKRKAKDISKLASFSCINPVMPIQKNSAPLKKAGKTSCSGKNQQKQIMNQYFQFQTFPTYPNIFYNPLSYQMPQYTDLTCQQQMPVPQQTNFSFDQDAEVIEIGFHPFTSNDPFEEFEQNIDDDEQTNEEFIF